MTDEQLLYKSESLLGHEFQASLDDWFYNGLITMNQLKEFKEVHSFE